MTGWNDSRTAKTYDSYSKTYSSYKLTSRDLVRLAQVEKGHRVVDLACGTGVTSAALLDVLGETGHVYAVDLAPAMLAIAQENIQAANISFHHHSGESIHEIIPYPVDCMVSNSAFWQMDGDKVLQSIRRILVKKGCFAFNIPDSFSPICEQKERPINLRELMRQVAEEAFGLTFDTPLSKRSSKSYSIEKIKQTLTNNGFRLLNHEQLTYEEVRDSAKAFCTIPVMTESTLPGVDYDTRLAILESAYSRLEAETENELSAWDFYVASLD